MLTTSILFLLSSNAVTIRRDKSILYARIVITILLCCFFLCFNSFHTQFHDTGLGLFSGLYQTTSTTPVFHMFILLVTCLITHLTPFYLLAGKFNSLYKLVLFKVIYWLYDYERTIRFIQLTCVFMHLFFLLVLIIFTNDFLSIYVLEMQAGSDYSNTGQSDYTNPDYKPLPPVFDNDSKSWIPNPSNYPIHLEVSQSNDTAILKDNIDSVEITPSEYDKNFNVEGFKDSQHKSYQGSSAKVSADGCDITVTNDNLKIERDGEVIHDLHGKVSLTIDEDYILATCENQSGKVEVII